MEKAKSKSLPNAKLVFLGEMSAGIAHEINNPLAIASGNFELLERYVHDPEKFGQKVNTILKSLGRIEKIVSCANF